MPHARRHRCRLVARHLLVGVVGLALPAAVLAAPAQASAPSNDSIRTPVRVRTVPFTWEGSTLGATHSRTDGRCVQGSSVWFRFRPATTRTLRAVTIGSDYDTRLAVFRGSRTHRTLVRCNDDMSDGEFLTSALAVRFMAGHTYWIAASSCCGRAARGGNLVLNVYRPRTNTVSVSEVAADAGHVSGRAWVDATLACSVPSALEALVVSVSQRVGASGEGVARGTAELSAADCSDGSVWPVAVDSDTGWAFQPGAPAQVTMDVLADTGFGYTETSLAPVTITLGDAANLRTSR